MAALLVPLRVRLPPTACLLSRCYSSYVSRMRYMKRLKEDDAACLTALQRGRIFLFHRLSPLLQHTDTGTFKAVPLGSSVVQLILERFGLEGSLLKESVLIGCSDQNQAQFCLDVAELDPRAVEEECKGSFMDLRKSFFLLTTAEAPLLAKGQALLRWHQTSKFCSATGHPTHRNQAGSHRVSSRNGAIYYPKMSPVVIVLVSDGERCLLGRQPAFPRGMYSALAGFCDMGETLEEALRREVAEEVGLELQSISYSLSQHWPFPDSSFMLGCHASVSPAHTQLQVDHTELEDARWFSLEEVTSALKVKVPPQRGDPLVLWFPPQQAIAHQLLMEWTDQQRCSQAAQVKRSESRKHKDNNIL